MACLSTNIFFVITKVPVPIAATPVTAAILTAFFQRLILNYSAKYNFNEIFLIRRNQLVQLLIFHKIYLSEESSLLWGISILQFGRQMIACL